MIRHTGSMKNTLVTLAMLKVQIDEQKEVYVDYFVPYFLQGIKQQYHANNKHTELDFNETLEYIQSKYGLKIPLDVMELIIKRITKLHSKILKKETHKYFIVNVEDIPNQDTNFSGAERSITAVCNALVEFSKDRPLQFQNIEEAFEAILEFLSEFSIETLKNIERNNALPELSHRNNKRIVLTALFIRYLSEHDTENYNNISNIVKGYMLTNVLLCLDITEQGARINTCFYIDTPLILSCLGFNGETNKKQIKELFELILKLGGKLCVFSHTLEEVQNVIAFCGNPVDTPAYIKKQELTTTDILSIQGNLEDRLKKEEIKIVQTPTVANQKNSYQHQIDELELGNRLKQEIKYSGQKSHEYDAKSVVAIHLLRRSKVHYKLEQVPSLITKNAKLVSTVAKFEHDNNIGGRCSTITNFMATNLLWLKKPMESPDLPMQTVIAQSYSLLDSPGLWEKFLQKAEQLQQKGGITKEEIQYLRGNEGIIQGIVSEATLGDQDELGDEQKVFEITEKAKRKITQEAVDRTAAVEEKLSSTSEIVRKLSDFIAHVFTISSYATLGVLLLITQPVFPDLASILIAILSVAGFLTYKIVCKFWKKKIANFVNNAK